MAIKDRRLFANGGEATSPIVLATDTGSGFVPSNKKVTLEEEGGAFFAVTTEDGIVLDKEEINLNLSPNRDPVDAYRKQEYNKNLNKLTLGLTGVAALPFFPTKVISRAGILGLNALKYAAPIKNIKLKKADFPLRRDASGKFTGRNPNNPFSYTAEIKPAQTGLYTGAAALTGQNLLEAEETEEVKDSIQESINELTEPTADASPEVVEDQKNVLEDAKEDVDTVIDRAAQLFTEDALDQPETIDIPFEQKKQGEFSEPADEPQKRTRGFFNSPEFLTAVRNIGKALVVEGQFGTGLAKGIVLAGEETQARKEQEKLIAIEREEQEREFLNEVALKGIEDSTKFQEFLRKEKVRNLRPDKVAKETNTLSAAIADIEEADVTLQMFEKAKRLIAENDTTGFFPLINSGFAQASRFFINPNTPLTARERAIIVLEQIANGNIKSITGESGKTISNVDRQIAQNLVGNLKNPLIGESVILERIENQILSVQQRKREAENNYKASSLYFTENEVAVPFEPKRIILDDVDYTSGTTYTEKEFDATLD